MLPAMRLPFALLVAALPVIAPAQTAIHRCIGASGNPVFTDQPCATMQASPVRASPGPEGAPPATPPMLCAASRDDLRQGVIEAFAQQDANRLAGLMLWNGYGRGAATADIQALANLVRQPLLGIEFPGDPASANNTGTPYPDAAAPPAAAPAASTLVLDVADRTGADARQWHFDLVHRAGCLWLRNTD
jgi:hypothetical protein